MFELEVWGLVWNRMRGSEGPSCRGKSSLMRSAVMCRIFLFLLTSPFWKVIGAKVLMDMSCDYMDWIWVVAAIIDVWLTQEHSRYTTTGMQWRSWLGILPKLNSTMILIRLGIFRRVWLNLATRKSIHLSCTHLIGYAKIPHRSPNFWFTHKGLLVGLFGRMFSCPSIYAFLSLIWYQIAHKNKEASTNDVTGEVINGVPAISRILHAYVHHTTGSGLVFLQFRHNYFWHTFISNDDWLSLFSFKIPIFISSMCRYTQGMGIMVAYMLLGMGDEEQTFWLFCAGASFPPTQ